MIQPIYLFTTDTACGHNTVPFGSLTEAKKEKNNFLKRLWIERYHPEAEDTGDKYPDLTEKQIEDLIKIEQRKGDLYQCEILEHYVNIPLPSIILFKGDYTFSVVKHPDNLVLETKLKDIVSMLYERTVVASEINLIEKFATFYLEPSYGNHFFTEVSYELIEMDIFDVDN